MSSQESSLVFGVPGVINSNFSNTESQETYSNSQQSQSPQLSTSDLSESFPSPPPQQRISSPQSLAATGKRLWSESSSWISSRLTNSFTPQSSFSFDNLSNFNYKDPTQVERSNLLNITKLVIKELIEWSMATQGRSLDSDHPPLQHFFIVLEHAMRHGLKPKKGLLGPKKELWDVLQLVEKCTTEAQDITNSIRDLPTVSTQIGRARAWLKLALMQKKLADYFKILVDYRDDLLKDFYEPFALLMSDEAPILAGLLIGLNVIDCNFCLKEEDLDSQQGVIDFSLYLRSSKSSEAIEIEGDTHNNLDSVLDQKNYVEELNRHLNATVTNLQTKVETLTTTNELMKEDLAISKNTIISMQDENRNLRLRLEQFTNLQEDAFVNISIPASQYSSATENGKNESEKDDSSIASSILATSPLPANLSVTDLSKKLHDERTVRSNLEKEMEIHLNQKSEMELAMKLMEKDVHEKQDTIITLRQQLDDIKQINLEMYRKLQECEKTVKHKSELISKLDDKSSLLTETINNLDEKLNGTEAQLKTNKEMVRNLGAQMTEKEHKISMLEGDIRIEREWRQSLQDNVVKDKEKISELNMDIQRLKLVTQELDNKKLEIEKLQKTCRQQEDTLTDMGKLMRDSDLRLDQLRESSKATLDAHWEKDKEIPHCTSCKKDFNFTTRRHHCRNCGRIFCKMCSDQEMPLPSFPKPVRVCDPCSIILLEKCSANL